VTKWWIIQNNSLSVNTIKQKICLSDGIKRPGFVLASQDICAIRKSQCPNILLSMRPK